MPTALITGTNSGIGLASAVAFARGGFRVYAGLRNPERATELRGAISAEGLDMEILEFDVTDADASRAAVQRVLDEGPLDVLVNNAGIGGATPLEFVPEDEHRLIMEVNYFGAIRLMQAVLPSMRERGSGRIINVTSGAGRFATANQVPYTASKFALEGASEALAQEVARFGIQVSLIEPGIVETALFDNSAPYSRFDKQSPYVDLMKRNGRLYVAGRKTPTTPEAAAAVLLEAATAPEPKFRYVVGADAEKLLGGRATLTDEEFIALAGTPSNEEYYVTFKRIFGIELG